jgi:hypothetical protein
MRTRFSCCTKFVSTTRRTARAAHDRLSPVDPGPTGLGVYSPSEHPDDAQAGEVAAAEEPSEVATHTGEVTRVTGASSHWLRSTDPLGVARTMLAVAGERALTPRSAQATLQRSLTTLWMGVVATAYVQALREDVVVLIERSKLRRAMLCDATYDIRAMPYGCQEAHHIVPVTAGHGEHLVIPHNAGIRITPKSTGTG